MAKHPVDRMGTCCLWLGNAPPFNADMTRHKEKLYSLFRTCNATVSVAFTVLNILELVGFGEVKRSGVSSF
jgi:hypothetical protein